MIRKVFTSLTLLCWMLAANAQVTDAERKYTAFDMRSNGKIYVVVAVMLVILMGLLFYLFRIDRRITKLEKQTK